MNQAHCLQAIMDLPGQKEMKDVARQWSVVAKNLSSMPPGAAMVLPDLLWVTKAGAGKTYLLRLMSEYLATTGMVDFYGDVKYFEFLLEYCPPEGPLDELSRLVETVYTAAGFRNEYRGVMCLDISNWRGHYEEAHFRRVLEYLASVDDHVLIVFVAENLPEDDLKAAEKLLHAYFRIRKVRMPYPSAADLAKYCAKRLAEYGMQLDEGAVRLLQESIEELKSSRSFDGFKTLGRMCQDIVFDLCASGVGAAGVVSASMLENYSKDSAFVENLCEMNRIRQVGWGKV